jgi:WXG100 family type VII secretion target
MSAGEDSLYVNYLGVSNVGDALQDATGQIQAMYGDLMKDCQPLVQTWTGKPAEVWQSLQTQWNNDINDMQNILNAYRGTLDDMSIHYSNTDNQLANSWAGIS